MSISKGTENIIGYLGGIVAIVSLVALHRMGQPGWKIFLVAVAAILATLVAHRFANVRRADRGMGYKSFREKVQREEAERERKRNP